MLDYQKSVELRSSLGMNDEVYFKSSPGYGGSRLGGKAGVGVSSP